MKNPGKKAKLLDNISKKKTQIKQLEIQINFSTSELKKALDDLKNLENTVRQLKSSESMKISDHAFVRWLERVKVIPVESFKLEALSELPDYLPDGDHKINGWTYVVRDNILVTIK